MAAESAIKRGYWLLEDNETCRRVAPVAEGTNAPRPIHA